jgi:hypothetical protein
MKSLFKLMMAAGIVFLLSWASPSRVAAVPMCPTGSGYPACPLGGPCTVSKPCCNGNRLLVCICTNGTYSCPPF